MKTALAILLALSLAAPMFAQNKPKVVDKKFVALTIASIASAVADEEVTQYLVHKNPNLHEANPLLGDTRKTAYPVMAGFTAMSTYFSYRAKKAGDKTWLIPQVISVGVHGFAISWNLTR